MWHLVISVTQSVFVSSKPTVEKPDQGLKSVQWDHRLHHGKNGLTFGVFVSIKWLQLSLHDFNLEINFASQLFEFILKLDLHCNSSERPKNEEPKNCSWLKNKTSNPRLRIYINTYIYVNAYIFLYMNKKTDHYFVT